MNTGGPRIVVVGSANTDLTVKAERLPGAGQTVLGGQLLQAGGGKGANQAVAAARAGARVALVGRLGDDQFARTALRDLEREAIDTTCVALDADAPTGVALIVVDRQGENLIAVAPGANARLSPQDIRNARPLMAQADLILLQLEIPLETVGAAVQTAKAAGVRVMLNPAPAPGPHALDDLLPALDYLTPNRVEAARLVGTAADAEPAQMALRLAAMGPPAVVITLGAEGVCICEGGRCTRMEAPCVPAVDTVGAGDCFAGALATALGEGRSLSAAVRFAACAAALSVQVTGAQPSMPYREQIDSFLQTLD